MAGAEVVTHAWKEWVLQALVLLSFMLQVALLILAEFRRRVDHAAIRLLVWSAYMLADGTAIYVLGHLAATASRSPQHELMAFWAPFLLLHLGGQDNITAYAIEDNRLWLRHLQTLVVQVAAAGYVLYGSSIVGNNSLLKCAAILVFVVGVVKYGERVWALRCAGSRPWGMNYHHFTISWETTRYDHTVDNTGHLDTEDLLLMAHGMLCIGKNRLIGPVPNLVIELEGCSRLRGHELYKIVQMQLSLMHDVFYTKIEAMHSWFGGLCIRVALPVATAVAFLMFHQWRGNHRLDGYTSADITATYVLLVGALVLEMVSALRGIFSIWTCRFLRDRCYFLFRAIIYLRRFVHAAEWRKKYWSGSMGQQSLLQLCACSRASRMSKLARWMGVEDWWNTLAYSSFIPVSSSIERMLIQQVLKSKSTNEHGLDHIRNSCGRAVLKSFRLYERLAWSIIPELLGLEKSILVWHIATEVYLCWYMRNRPANWENVSNARALSNYMLFLVAARPFMLSSTATRYEYADMCYCLTGLRYSTAQDLTKILWDYGAALNGGNHEFHFPVLDNFVRPPLDNTVIASRILRENETLERGCRLGAQLIDVDEELQHRRQATDMLGLIVKVWVDTLFYVGRRCNVDFHAKQLSSGGIREFHSPGADRSSVLPVRHATIELIFRPLFDGILQYLNSVYYTYPMING
uniref:DUF4220 domain-containing protein n=1 Tax=Leersia perrieri TaxID=77586 RepID=A0A0D9UWV9_9ORYZ